MKIIAKSFPARSQVQGRIDSRAFDGVELFVLDNILEDPGIYGELAAYTRDHFPIVNFETFHGVSVNGTRCTTSHIDPRPEVRARSRALLEATLELADGQGTVNTHFVGIPKVAAGGKDYLSPIPPVAEQVAMTGEYLASRGHPNIICENVITYNNDEAEGGFNTYQTGVDMVDFATLFREFGIPMCLDTAHLAICLEQYRVKASDAEFSFEGETIETPFTERHRELGERVCKEGLMSVWLDKVRSLPQGAATNVHFINGKSEPNGDYQDGYVGFSRRNHRLLDLDKALDCLTGRGDVKFIVPEVVDGIYAPTNPNYVRAPKMVEMARTLRGKLNS